MTVSAYLTSVGTMEGYYIFEEDGDVIKVEVARLHKQPMLM